MDQNSAFSHMQQFTAGWVKLMTDSAQKFADLVQVEKLEKQGVAQAVSAVDEASRLAKEAINSAENLTAQWRKTVTAYAERTLDLVNPKN